MYGRSRRGYGSGRRFGGPRFPLLVAALVLGGLFLLPAVGHAFYLLHFLPFFLLLWVAFSVVRPMVRGASFGRSSEVSEGRERGPVEEEQKERQLLRALERCGELSPAKASLETTLSISEADRMLSRLAKDGHLEVHAREGRLAYSLWDRDRREKKELADGS